MINTDLMIVNSNRSTLHNYSPTICNYKLLLHSPLLPIIYIVSIYALYTNSFRFVYCLYLQEIQFVFMGNTNCIQFENQKAYSFIREIHDDEVVDYVWE